MSKFLLAVEGRRRDEGLVTKRRVYQGQDVVSRTVPKYRNVERRDLYKVKRV